MIINQLDHASLIEHLLNDLYLVEQIRVFQFSQFWLSSILIESEKMGDDSVAVDLNLTLLKRDYFLKLVKKFTVLESKIRRHKLFDTSTETIEKTYGQLKAFLLTLHSEFGKTGEILQTFLTGIEQILGYFKLIRPHLQGK